MSEISERRANLLKNIVEEYVRTAVPVGSAHLCGQKGFDCSPATIRKEMAELEEEGFIHQPHTSAGRVPTELGYRYYIEHFLKAKDASAPKLESMARDLRGSAPDLRDVMKRFAKALAEFTSHTVIIGFGPTDAYYTGISNLFAKPEFIETGRVATLSSVVDRFDEVVTRIFETSNGVVVQVGSECPFGDECGSVIAKCTVAKTPILLTLLGPMRMPYDRLLGIAVQTKELLEKLEE
ncbi:MAG: heat-inducible transcriptional repressor HrcA [bacterium]